MNDSKGAKFVRGLVKTVFILCFGAFMYASIGHVAVFFQSYEQSGGSDIFGSYLVAGAIDITALITTTGVMFFRKSMPRTVQIVLWAFIIGLALYSFLINWEYASHFQTASLLLQPTGKTTPVYDTHGVLHYVPEMRLNTTLELINPALASCFTIFALIYSVVGEFFGAKQPTADELLKKKQYLESTAGILEQIRSLEEKGRGPSMISRATAAAKEIKAAAKALTNDGEEEKEPSQETEPETDTLPSDNEQEASDEEGIYENLSDEESRVAKRYPKTLSWLNTSGTTVSLKEVVATMNVSTKLLHNRVASKDIRATRNKEIVFKDSVIAWAIAELLPTETKQATRSKANKAEAESSQDSEPDTTPHLGMIESAMLKALREASPDIQQELRAIAESQPIEELIRNLQDRYPQHAHFFNVERVRNVMAVFQADPVANPV